MKTEHKRLTDIFEKIERNGRELPKNLDMEESVLGCIMLAPELADKCFEVLGDNVFYYEQHRVCFDVCKSIYILKVNPDLLAVNDEARKRGLTDMLPMSWLAKIVSGGFNPAFLSGYLTKLTELHTKRKLALSFEKLVLECMIDEQPLKEILDAADVEILRTRSGNTKNEPKKISDISGILTNPDSVVGYRTGFEGLDRMMNNGMGFSGGQYVIIAARPSVGKTTLAINIASNMARNSTPCLFFSHEMQNASIVKKVFEYFSGVEAWKVNPKYERVHISEDEHKSIRDAHGIISNLPLHIDDSSNLTPMDIRSRVSRWKMLYDIKVVFIDYVQIMRPSEKQQNREREIGSISQDIKAIAKEFDVVMVVLSQLNRISTSTEGKKPSVAHLRDSGSLEQDADTIILPYDPLQTDTGNPNEIRDVELIVGKNREGICGSTKVKFEGKISRFYEDINFNEDRFETAQSITNQVTKYIPTLFPKKKPEVYPDAPF